MRSPVLIAETPFAGGHGPRFLPRPGRAVDPATAAHYVGKARDVEDDVEEIEGDDYLAVRLPLKDPDTEAVAHDFMLLAGIDVDRMTAEERDEVLEQLRERLEVLNDAVAAVDWSVHAYDPVVEIPELEEWHEPSWDALPRAGMWAEEIVPADQPSHSSHESHEVHAGDVEDRPSDPAPDEPERETLADWGNIVRGSDPAPEDHAGDDDRWHGADEPAAQPAAAIPP